MTAVMTTNIINVNNHFNNVLRKLRAGQTVSSVVREEGWAAPVLEQMQTWYTFDYEDYMSDVRTIEAGDMLRDLDSAEDACNLLMVYAATRRDGFDYKDAYYEMCRLNDESSDYRANVLAVIENAAA